jgi:hypothetical protein
MVVFLNGIRLSRSGYSTIIGMQLLIIFSCKPQLLVADLAVLFLLAAKYCRQNYSLALLHLVSSILPLFLLIVGRQNSHSLQLQIGLREIVIGLTAFTIVPIALIVPAIFVGLSGFLRIYSQSLMISVLELTLVITEGVFFFSKRTDIKSIISTQRKQIIFVSSIPLYISLFIFGNSTWGNDLFWRVQCTECLFQRHIFPLVVLIVFSLVQVRNTLLRKSLIYALLIQVLALGFFAYSALYSSI